MSIQSKPRTSALIFSNIQRIFYGVLAAVSMALVMLTGCTRPASKSPVNNPATSEPSITIEGVQVSPNNGVYISGRAILPSGACLQTELLEDGEPAGWWPKNECVQVDTGQWEFLVAFGKNGAPDQLENGVQYEIHAWWPKDPAVSTRFPFDIDGPASP